MKNSNTFKTQYIIPIVLAVVGVYLIYKNFVGKKTEELPEPASGTPTSPPVKIDPAVGTTTPKTNISDIKAYTVTTTSGNLNLRSLPSASSTLVGTLPKGSEVKGKPSTIVGWTEIVEVSPFGNPYQVTTKGYVSSSFLTAKG